MSSTDPIRIAWEEYERAHPIVVPSELESPHPITSRTAAAKGWAAETPSAGPKPDRYKCFNVVLHYVKPQRALLLIDTLLKACEARGFELRHNPNGSHEGVSIFIDAEPVPLQLIERGTIVTYLSLETSKTGKIWKDNPRRPLEKRLNKIMVDLRQIVAWRLEQRRECAEIERKFAELEFKRAELREEVTRERKALDELLEEAEGWQKAKAIRAYVAAVRALAKRQGTLADHKEWVEWAYDQADRFDPLCVSPPSILDTPRKQYRELDQFEVLDEDGNIERIWG